MTSNRGCFLKQTWKDLFCFRGSHLFAKLCLLRVPKPTALKSCANTPFWELLLPLFQNDPWCTIYHMKLRFSCTVIVLQIKLISTRKLCTWNRFEESLKVKSNSEPMLLEKDWVLLTSPKHSPIVNTPSLYNRHPKKPPNTPTNALKRMWAKKKKQKKKYSYWPALEQTQWRTEN